MERKAIDTEFRDNEIATVVFTKKDGSERVTKCTKKPELIPEESRPKETGEEKDYSNDPVYKVFDVEANGWRCFTIENLISINGVNV